MSLMNDALRKKRSEKKHPSATDFLKTDPESNSKSKIKMIGLVLIGLFICTIGGYFGYEYYSLSRPMTPHQPSPLVAATTPPPSQSEPAPEVGMNQAGDGHEPLKTDPPGEQNPDKPATEIAAKAQTDSRPQTETAKIEEDQPEDAKRQSPAALAKSETTSRQASPMPTPVIEPDGPAPAPPSPKPPSPQKAATPRELSLAQNKPASIAERFYRKGLSYHRQNNLEKAIPMYLAARKKDPNHTATSFNLASAYIQVGAYAEAQTILSDLHVKEPGNPEVLLNMAVVELGMDHPEQALAFLDRAALKFVQPRYEVLFHQGTAHSRLGNFNQAITFYQKAARIAPEKARLSLNIAIAYDNLNQYDQAIEYYLSSLDQYQNLDLTERHEIEKRVRELKAYLAQTQQ